MTDSEAVQRLHSLCPARIKLGFYKYKVRTNDGRIFTSGGWRRIGSVIKRRGYSLKRAKEIAKKFGDIDPVERVKIESLEGKKKLRYERQKKRRQANKEKYNESIRRWYDRNKEHARSEEYKRREKRDPTYGLTSLALRVGRGEAGLDELTGRFDRALAQINEICRESKSGGGDGVSKGSSVSSQLGVQLREEYNSTSEGQTRSIQGNVKRK